MALGMDPWGRKMSKSLGNGIDADSVLSAEQVDEQVHGKFVDLRSPSASKPVKLEVNVSAFGRHVKTGW